MRKYLIFIMLLLTVLACKPKQRPGSKVDGGGGNITLPPIIQTEDERKILDTFTNMVENNDDSPSGWQVSGWKDVPRLAETDLGKITDGGFFISRYANENWIVLAVSTNRNVYTGLSKGAGELQKAMSELADESGNLRAESWDPRKLVYNQVEDVEDPDRLLSIAWLGRAMWDQKYGDQGNTSYKDYDAEYGNALKYLTGDAKTYGILRNYKNERTYDYMDDSLKTNEGHSWGNGTFPMEVALGNEERKVWGYWFYDPNMNHILKAPYYKQGSGITRVSSYRGMRFAYAKKEGGYPGGDPTYPLGTYGRKATPLNATWETKQPGGEHYEGYNTMYPRGKTVLERTPLHTDNNGARVLFLNSVVAYNLRMRDAQNEDAKGLFGGKYNVKEVIFEFDDSTFQDVMSDNFTAFDFPKRENVDATLEIKNGATDNSHKLPLLYFSPKP